MKNKAVIVSRYFNSINKGYLECFYNTKAIADELFVIVNNDNRRAPKGSKEFQGEQERMIIASSLKAVDLAILAVDEDRSVCATLGKITNEYDYSHKLRFANGVDQNKDTILERSVYIEMGITLIDGLGNKIQSRSWLLTKLGNA